MWPAVYTLQDALCYPTCNTQCHLPNITLPQSSTENWTFSTIKKCKHMEECQLYIRPEDQHVWLSILRATDWVCCVLRPSCFVYLFLPCSVCSIFCFIYFFLVLFISSLLGVWSFATSMPSVCFVCLSSLLRGSISLWFYSFVTSISSLLCVSMSSLFYVSTSSCV